MKNSGNRILVISSEAASSRAEGAGRCWRLAEALSRSQDVILALPEVTPASHRKFAVVYYNGWNIGMIARDSDAAICDAAVLAENPKLIGAGPPVAVDLCGLDPFEKRQSPDAEADPSAGGGPDSPGPGEEESGLKSVLAAADFFFCGDEESRGRWLERLKQSGRINRYTGKRDPEFQRLLGVVSLNEAPRPQTGGAGNWAVTAEAILPLEEFCAAPGFAADRGTEYNRAKLPVREKNSGLGYYLRRLRHHLRNGGPKAAAARGGAVTKRKFSDEEK